MRWTRKNIIAEINRLHQAGEALNYSAAEKNHLNLVRAAAWHFGSWRHAVESAGVDYESLSRYQRWSKARIIERIRELHNDGQDLSWRAISGHVDQPLAAAALRPNGFKSWRDALAAAGIDVENTARYKYWDEAKVIQAIRARQCTGAPMSSKALQKSDQPLFCAARRRFGSWDGALDAAGFNSETIRLRRYNSPRVKTTEKTSKVAAKTVAKKAVAKKAVAKKAVIPKTVALKAVVKKAVAKKVVVTKIGVKTVAPKDAVKPAAKQSAKKPADKRAAR